LQEARYAVPDSVGQRRRQDQLTNVERHVAARIRQRRVVLGLSQPQLAALIKVTYQQLHKYEVGANHISAGRLFQLAAALGVDVAYFFAGVANASTFAPPPHLPQLVALARNFARIRSAKQREAVCEIVRVMATARAADDQHMQSAESRPT
jgi:transcriptional regulator with XRE-family HTH domain